MLKTKRGNYDKQNKNDHNPAGSDTLVLYTYKEKPGYVFRFQSKRNCV